MPAALYLDRWALLQLMVELKHESALDFIDQLLGSRLPPEDSKDPESLSTVGEEVMIRTTAVDAVARMAADGSPRALEVLLRHVGHENFSVKRAAIQAFVAHGGEQARAVLAKAVAERDQYIMDIQRIDVRQAPQAQGGLYLKCRDSQDALPGHNLGRGLGNEDKPGGSNSGGSSGCNC